jgi:myo-inositol-1(or 4)-monophosphatase
MVSNEHLRFARELAFGAGKIILQGFGEAADVKYKPDGSPVTDIDIRVNQIISESIHSRYPEHGLLGEELGFGTGFESFRWICDPLDGTIPFILGIPNSMFMLALMADDDLRVAVAYDPFGGRLYHATKDGGAFCNDYPIHVSNQTIRDGYLVLDTDSLPFITVINQARGRIAAAAGTGYRAMMVACGKAVGTVKDNADFHDIAPASLIVTEAGGCVTDLNGSQLTLDKEIQGGVIISNRLAHQQLVDILRALGREVAYVRQVLQGAQYSYSVIQLRVEI